MSTTRNDDRVSESPLDLEMACDAERAAEITGLHVVTLQQLRARGQGPRWFKAGSRAVRYRLGDLLQWRDQRMVGGSR
jgi:predicted DNA-binding transcriptional regulator AlpA